MSSSLSRTIKKPRLSSARRCLFGRPSKDEVDSWLSSVSQMIRRKDEEKWGFSFEREMPLPSTSSPYSYQLVDASTVPSFYRLSRYESPPSVPSPMEEDTLDISMDSMHESSSDESFSSLSSHPPVTPKKSSKKRETQSKITNFYVHRRKSGKFSKESTPSSSPLPLPSAIQHI